MAKKFLTQPGLALAVVITLLKLLIINADPPQWTVGYYQPIDELYYVFPSYSLFESGHASTEDTPLRLYGSPGITNFLTLITLGIFGESYTGLRLPSLIFSLITVVAFYYVLRAITSNKFLLFVLPTFLALNFNFSLASIMVEPTIARMAMMMLMISVTAYVVDKYKTTLAVFCLGAVGALLVILTYPTNIFVLAGIGVALILINLRKDVYVNATQFIKRSVSTSILFIAGIAVGIAVFLVITSLVGLNELEAVSARTSTFSYRVGGTAKFLWANTINIGWGNLFVFNAALFVLLVVSLPLAWFRKITSWPIALVLTYTVCVSFLLQCVFINDYPQRKLIILLPLILALFAGGVENWAYTVRSLSKATRTCVNIVLLIFATSVIYLYPKVFEPDYVHLLGDTSRLCAYGALAATGVYLFMPRRFQTYLAIAIFGIVLTPEILMIKEHFIENRTRHYRQAFRKLREYDGKEFLGGFSIGFRPYNSIKSSVNYYMYVDNPELFWKKTQELAIANPDITYSIGYTSQIEDYRKINFHPKEVLLTADQCTDRGEIMIFEEGPAQTSEVSP